MHTNIARWRWLRTESNLGQELMLDFALIRESKETILTATKAITTSLLQRPNCSGSQDFWQQESRRDGTNRNL
jgi:hypothetical protein